MWELIKCRHYYLSQDVSYNSIRKKYCPLLLKYFNNSTLFLFIRFFIYLTSLITSAVFSFYIDSTIKKAKQTSRCQVSLGRFPRTTYRAKGPGVAPGCLPRDVDHWAIMPSPGQVTSYAMYT